MEKGPNLLRRPSSREPRGRFVGLIVEPDEFFMEKTNAE